MTRIDRFHSIKFIFVLVFFFWIIWFTQCNTIFSNIFNVHAFSECFAAKYFSIEVKKKNIMSTYGVTKNVWMTIDGKKWFVGNCAVWMWNEFQAIICHRFGIRIFFSLFLFLSPSFVSIFIYNRLTLCAFDQSKWNYRTELRALQYQHSRC